MKKILMAEYLEYNSNFKVGNHHYAKMFAENGYEVLWLSPVYNYITRIKNKEVYNQRKELNKKVFTSLDENIYGYAPHSLVLYGKIPLLDTRLANKASIGLTIPGLKKVLEYNGFDSVDILWLTNPKYYYLTEMLRYKKLIYRCADDISGFKEVCRTIPYFEDEIIKKSDTVFVTAQSLIEKKKHLRSDVVYLPNGVQLSNFIRDKYLLPDEYKGSERKKVIYVGAINHWFETELVRYAAEKLKNIDFYIIGKVETDLSRLSDIKNVYLLGRRAYESIPDYLYYSDAGIIPFMVNSLTDSISPIKLYEYMSTGLNVVTTNFKEMQHIKSPAYIAENNEQFCDFIERAIENKAKDKERNIAFAKENTWDNRFGMIKEYLEDK